MLQCEMLNNNQRSVVCPGYARSEIESQRHVLVNIGVHLDTYRCVNKSNLYYNNIVGITYRLCQNLTTPGAVPGQLFISILVYNLRHMFSVGCMSKTSTINLYTQTICIHFVSKNNIFLAQWEMVDPLAGIL